MRLAAGFRLGLGPADPAGGTYSAPPDPLAGFGGSTSKEREREGGEGRRGEGKGGEGRGRKGPWAPSLFGGSLRLCSWAPNLIMWCPCLRTTCASLHQNRLICFQTIMFTSLAMDERMDGCTDRWKAEWTGWEHHASLACRRHKNVEDTMRLPCIHYQWKLLK